jgi:tRNA(Ser,Leu) C12 N-acetylase TAN1
MWAFNLVVTTASAGRYHHLLRELAPLGEFRPTEFHGVILGRVDDPHAFLEAVRERRERQLIAFQDLGRAVPVDRTFTFHLEEFLDQAREAIRPWLDELAGQRFYVRLERRGLKGRIVSPEAERALDGFVLEELGKAGKTAEVGFEHPDAVVVIETIGDRAGVGLLTREMLERYDFVRVG